MDPGTIPNDWFEVIKITELPQSVKVFMWEYTAGQNDRFYNGFYHAPLWKGGEVIIGDDLVLRNGEVVCRPGPNFCM